MPESGMLANPAPHGLHEASEGRACDGPLVDGVASQPEAKFEAKLASQPAPKSYSQSDSRSDLQPDSQPDSRSDSRSDLPPDSHSGLRPATRYWNARLEVRVARRAAASIAVHRRHRGPLRLQKPLYPEGPGVAHLLVVHPPAGIAGGDRLEIDIDVSNDAHALVTMPGATKWYRSDGARAHQHVALTVARGACLEWLPPENIVFDGADLHTSTTIACERGATCIGWDIVVLGRRASGECFEEGAVRQDLTLSCDDRMLWRERARLIGADALLASRTGWSGRAVAGVLWAWGSALSDADLERCRDATMARPDAGITVLGDGLVVARALSDSAERVRDLFHELWAIIRPAMTARCAIRPRIWAT